MSIEKKNNAEEQSGQPDRPKSSGCIESTARESRSLVHIEYKYFLLKE